MSFANVGRDIAALQPELHLGGYSAYDGTMEFYGRIKALVDANSIVVDLGAGRGAWFELDESEPRKRARLLKGTVRQVIGLDVDPAVLGNRAVDRAEVLVPGRSWPLGNESVDHMVCDYVLEHVKDVRVFCDEVFRVLRPGGWFCARTPTKYNYVSIGARLVSNVRHASVLRSIQPGRQAEDVFPTYYKLNSRAEVAKAFGSGRFENFSYLYCFEPQYHFGKAWIYRTFQFAHKLLPAVLVGNLFVFLRKRTEGLPA